MREKEQTTDYFVRTVEEALDHFGDVRWLGKHSPFAAPYFLHRQLKNESHTESSRGEVLQSILVALSKSITGSQAEHYRRLLELYYFEEIPPGEVQKRLNIGRTKLSQDRRVALSLLANELIRFNYPALRLEEPPIQTMLVHSGSHQKMIFDLLQSRHTVALVGAGGIGKTTLAALLTRAFVKAGNSAFWYTIRPDLNDQVESFVFALGYFAHQKGFSILWQELIASQGKAASEPKREKLMQMLRHLFSQMRPTPLLCIDEVDQLQSSPDHASLIRLIESLRGLVPILLAGQHSNIVCDHNEVLHGLNQEAMVELLQIHGVRFPPQQQQKLHEITQGNPRLVHLYCQALQSGEQHDDLLTALSRLSIWETLLGRVLQRLTQAELVVIMQLSVYPAPAPVYIAKADTIKRLAQKQLVQIDGKGSVEIPLLYRLLIRDNLPIEQQALLHRQAALMRSSVGTITAAAYHWIEAGDYYQAFLEWERHQHHEINQGQAATALRLFRRLATKPLPDDLCDQIQLICANLENLVGQPEIALEDIRTLLQKQSAVAIDAYALAGSIHNDRLEDLQAQAAFQQAQKQAEQIVEIRLASIHKGLAWGYWNDAEIEKAEVEINLASYEVENMRGNLARERGLFAKAVEHYHAAIALAEATHNEAGIAKSSNQLAGVLMWQGKFDECFQALQRAYTIYERIGNLRTMAGVLISQAVANNLAGTHAEALRLLERAEKLLEFLLEIERNMWLPILQARAEAYLGLGELDRAESLASKVIYMEDILMSRDAKWVLGEVAAQRNELARAEQFLKESIQLCELEPTNPDRYMAALANRSLAIVLLKQGKYDDVAVVQQRTIDYFTSLDLEFEIQRTKQMWTHYITSAHSEFRGVIS